MHTIPGAQDQAILLTAPPSRQRVLGPRLRFSWTYLFFGWFVPLFRGELGVAALHLLFSLFTFGLWQFVVCFLYNKQYMTRMLEKGYVLKDTEENMARARAALGVAQV